MSFIYAERLLEFAIRIGFDDLQKDPELLSRVFNIDPGLGLGRDLGGPTERLVFEEFQDRLNAIPRRESEAGNTSIFRLTVPTIEDIQRLMESANMHIVHGFPRSSQDLPCISITLGGESERQYLGDIKDRTINTETGKSYIHLGTENQAQYRIAIVTTNLDETVLWHYIVKYAMLRYRPHLEGYGIAEQKVSWMDVEPDEALIQAGIFAYTRVCIIDCTKQESVPIEESGFDTLVMGGIVGLPGSVADGAAVVDPDEVL